MPSLRATIGARQSRNCEGIASPACWQTGKGEGEHLFRHLAVIVLMSLFTSPYPLLKERKIMYEYSTNYR